MLTLEFTVPAGVLAREHINRILKGLEVLHAAGLVHLNLEEKTWECPTQAGHASLMSRALSRYQREYTLNFAQVSTARISQYKKVICGEVLTSVLTVLIRCGTGIHTNTCHPVRH